MALANSNLPPLILFRSPLGTPLCSVETKTIQITGHNMWGAPTIRTFKNPSFKAWRIEPYLIGNEVQLLDEFLFWQVNEPGYIVLLDRCNPVNLLEAAHGNRKSHKSMFLDESQCFIETFVLLEENGPRRKTAKGYVAQFTAHELGH